MLKKRILIADGNSRYARSLVETLNMESYDTEAVASGADALAALSEGEFDILITNWMMPGVDGIRLTRQVREKVRPTPGIIMLSSLASDEARKHAIASGVDDYIVQPVQNSELLRKIESFLEKRRTKSESFSFVCR